jgi:hypothetical protein
MSTIAEVAARFARLDLMKEAQIAIGKTEKAMIRAQIRQRKEAGIDGKGKKLRSYSWNYELWKKSQGKDTSVTNLTLTGALNDAMYVDVNGDEFEIGSHDGKVDKLIDWAESEDILSLAPDYIAEYVENDLFPQFAEQVSKALQLDFK